MTKLEQIKEAVAIRDRLMLVLARRPEVRRSPGAFGERGGPHRGMGAGGPGRGGTRGASGRDGAAFSNRIGGVGAGVEAAKAPVKSPLPPAGTAAAKATTLDLDVAEALYVGAVVVGRLAESFERAVDVTTSRSVLDAIPRLVPASAAHLPIAAAIREVVSPLLGDRFAEAPGDRVAVLRLLHSEIGYLLSKAPERGPFDGRDERRGGPPRGGPPRGERGPGPGRDREGGRDRDRDAHKRG